MPTWLLTLLPLLPNLLTSVAQLWNSSSGNTIQKVEQFITGSQSQPAIAALTAWGESLFPQLKGIEAAASALLTAAQSHAGAITWLQDGLNAAQALGIVSFNGQGTLAAGSTTVGTNSPLTVDGVYGRMTQAALIAFQTRFGLPATGVFTDAENTILTALSTGGLPAAIQAAFATLVADIQKII